MTFYYVIIFNPCILLFPLSDPSHGSSPDASQTEPPSSVFLSADDAVQDSTEILEIYDFLISKCI